MRVAVAGVDTVVGRHAVAGLAAAGHQVVSLGPAGRCLLDADAMTRSLAGCDALVNLSAPLPVGSGARWHRSWRTHDLLRTEGARVLVGAARAAGVRRVVHHSVSFVYADQGHEWVTERSPVAVTAATEPVSVGEMVVQDYASVCRAGVVLRMGLVVGDSGLTRSWLKAATLGRPFGLGTPDGFAHLLHSDDVAPAIEAALAAPSGVYNVGAAPVRRADLVEALAAAAGRTHGQFLPRWRTRVAGHRLEPLARSLRVSSDRFVTATGWSPRRPDLDLSWLVPSAPLRPVAV